MAAGPAGAAILGLIGGVVCFLAVYAKQFIKYDDSVRSRNHLRQTAYPGPLLKVLRHQGMISVLTKKR